MREPCHVLVSLGQTVGSCSPLPGILTRPSISAEPGSVVPWGRPVSIVCRGPAGVTTFRLEKDNKYNYKDAAVTSQGEQETEARYNITALREDDVGRYRCIYETESGWSEFSKALSLEGTTEAVSALPTGVPGAWLCPLPASPPPPPGPLPLFLLPTCPLPPCLAQLPEPGLTGQVRDP